MKVGMPETSVEVIKRKKRYGRCRICEKFRRLTKEHVPPESAFNDKGYLQFYADQVNEAEKLKWKVKDVNSKGIYIFTLCEECNRKTGTLYGTQYVDFVRAFSDVANPNNANSFVEVHIKNFFPARVVKQVISMVLSTSYPHSFENYTWAWNSDPPDLQRLRSVYNELRSFVRDKNTRGLPASVRLYAHAVANKGVGFRTGIFASGKRSTNSRYWVVVGGLWPIHWVLLLDGDIDEELLDVTEWASLGFKDRRNRRIQIPCRWSVGRMPLDPRSREEVSRDSFIGSMRLHGFVPEQGISKDQLWGAAMSFARRRGRWTKEGYLMTEFEMGTYFEAEGSRGWLEGATKDQARQFLKSRLAKEKKNDA
jgi:hypothetical protein